MIAVCGSNNAITLIDFKSADGSAQVILTIQNPHGIFDVNSVAWCPMKASGNLLASCGDDNEIHVHSINKL